VHRALEQWLPARAIEELADLTVVGDRVPADDEKEDEYFQPWWLWARRHNIAAACVVSWAHECSRGWSVRKARPRFPIAIIDLGSVRYSPAKCIGPPKPDRQSRADYLECAGRAWDLEADRLRQLGLQPVSTRAANVSLYCQWVIRKRVLGATLGELSTDAGFIDIGTISKAIKEMEDLIGFTKLVTVTS
jgi:hypothetical protein